MLHNERRLSDCLGFHFRCRLPKTLRLGRAVLHSKQCLPVLLRVAMAAPIEPSNQTYRFDYKVIENLKNKTILYIFI